MSAVGRRIDRYEIEAELDSGGFGTVYRARHTVIGRTVALKLLHPSRSDSLAIVERFLREARIVAALSSPHVVQVLDAGITDDRQLFLAMELLEGTTLAARLARTGPLAVRDALGIARQILAGLAAAHAAGVVHRDLKPANVFLARASSSMGPGDRETAKVLDFGISKSSGRGDESVITMTGAVLGTPHYMAPEQLHGARDVDARADLYALAVVLYEMLSGRLPYEAGTLEALIAKRLSDPPSLLGSVAPHVPREVLEIVERGLARDPDARFRSAHELDQALARVESVALPPTTPAGRAIVSPSGRPPPLGASASMILGATHATPSSVRPPGSPTGPLSSGAVMMRSPVTPRTAVAVAGATEPGLPPGTTRFPTRGISIGVLVMMLAGAGLVIVVLIAALASVTTAWWMTREAPAPAFATPSGSAPSSGGAPSSGTAPTAPPAPVPLPAGPVPAWDPLGTGPIPGLAPPAAAAPTAAPAHHDGPLRTWVDHVLGSADSRAFDELLERARPAVDRCRRSVDDDVRVQIFLNPGGAIPIAQPDPNAPHGDDETARCVARAIQGAAPLADPDASGIAIVLLHLPAR